MHIKQITSRSRRDFFAIYACEHCGHEEKMSGYDDDYFHRNVIPAMKCRQCEKVAGPDYVPMGTKYAPHEVI